VNTAANPLGPGRYCFRAHWGGDINYTTPIDEYGQSSNSVECFTVAKLPSGTVTTPSTGTVTLASINAGGFVTDTAVVTGTAAGGDPTGTVNFFICGPIASGTCDGTTTVGTAVSGNPVDLVPDGTVPPNDTTYTGSATSGHVTSSTITSVGRYCFRAVYSGDGHYLGSNDAGTGNSECFTVTDTSSETTEQNWLPNDSATVSSGGGTTLDGTGVFTLYDSANCSGTVLYSSDPTPGTNPADDIVVGGGSTVTVNTGNQTFKIKVANDRTVSWQFVYTSNDSSTTGSTSSCETTNLTITN